MSTSRRHLLQLAAAGGAVAGVAGFSAVSQFLSPMLMGGGDDLTAFRPPQGREIDEATHVLNRLTFGPRPGDLAVITKLGHRAWIERQLQPEDIDDSWTVARTRHFEALNVWPPGEFLEYSAKELLDQMTRAKMVRAIHSRRQLLEVMVDFWSDHFNIDPSKGDSKWLKPADDKNVIRAHALGNFRDLVKASALSPSMLWYLDGRVNRKASAKEKPNENYGRELLELHTLGVNGGYTQQDVMEIARCLTGWTVRERAKAADVALGAPLLPALDRALEAFKQRKIDAASPEGKRMEAMLLRVEDKLSRTERTMRAEDEKVVADDLLHDVEDALDAGDEALEVVRGRTR